MLLLLPNLQMGGSPVGAPIPDYKFVINPITGQLDRVVNNISVLKTDWANGSIPFADSNALSEENATLRYDKVNNRLLVDSYVIDKSSGKGIKVDLSNPTYGFADILGDQFTRNTGATKPTLATYNGVIKVWQFAAGKEAYLTYHIRHDYVPQSDIFLHIHWSQTGSLVTGGTLDFRYTAMYAKSHNQTSGSVFTASPITGLFSTIDVNDGGSGLNARQQFLTEVIISGSSLTSTLFDRNDFEPDGVIELTFEMDANNLTVSGGGVPDPFIHYVDIHYQTTGLIGTKAKAPDFYT